MTADQLADDAWALAAGAGGRCAVLGLAGPPGAGKSTLARGIVAAVCERYGNDAAAYLPLDGFHLSNAQLDRLGLRDRKGSEPSFDVWGYAALLRRVTAAGGAADGGGVDAHGADGVYVPDFDRHLDEPVAARHRVPPGVRLVVTEGNYLALDAPGWRAARELMAEVWYVAAPAAVRDARLMSRHTGFGRTDAAARAWIDANDAPNARLVEAARERCDREVEGAPPSGEVVVVSGPPGAGKSTVARLLAARYERSVRLHTDDFWAYVERGAIEPWRTESKEQNDTVVGVLAQAACGYAAGGYEVVVDGVVGPWYLGAYRSAAAAAGIPLHYVVLRPDETTTLARATGRGTEALTDVGALRTMHRQFADLGGHEPYALDTTALDAEATAAAVARGLAAGAYRLTGGDR